MYHLASTELFLYILPFINLHWLLYHVILWVNVSFPATLSSQDLCMFSCFLTIQVHAYLKQEIGLMFDVHLDAYHSIWLRIVCNLLVWYIFLSTCLYMTYTHIYECSSLCIIFTLTYFYKLIYTQFFIFVCWTWCFRDVIDLYWCISIFVFSAVSSTSYNRHVF